MTADVDVATRPALLLPRRLAPGDAIGVCTPSGPGAPICPERFTRGRSALRRLGFRVVVGEQAHAIGYAAGSAVARAREINVMLRDPEVRAVVASIGGLNANAVLPHLDYAALRADPKIIIGYSDITAVLLGVLAKAGVVTFHGPTLLPELAEYPAPLPYTVESMLATLAGRAAGPFTAPTEWTDELLLWGQQDNRRRTTHAHTGWRWLTPGTGTGPLLGGNLDTLCALVGTPYLPSFDGALLIWETCATTLAPVDRSLTQLDAAGITSRVAGMVIGRTFRAPDGFEDELRDFVADRYRARRIPILAGVDIGHTDPMLTLPLGSTARLDSTSGTFEVTGDAVR
jgi:muramoyltetrapeptide carboxypeptidase LdcA involved in peptidoglycan recycling